MRMMMMGQFLWSHEIKGFGKTCLETRSLLTIRCFHTHSRDVTVMQHLGQIKTQVEAFHCCSSCTVCLTHHSSNQPPHFHTHSADDLRSGRTLLSRCWSLFLQRPSGAKAAPVWCTIATTWAGSRGGGYPGRVTGSDLSSRPAESHKSSSKAWRHPGSAPPLRCDHTCLK